jgi:serine/threonine protein kinase/formylglycine-generating enzyme required for sulfatase activity
MNAAPSNKVFDNLSPILDSLLGNWEERCRIDPLVRAEDLCSGPPELLAELKEGIEQLRLVNEVLFNDPLSPEETPPPRQIGQYKVEEILGWGSSGIVYRAWDPVAKRPVALKVLRSLGVVDQQVLEQRFGKEIEVWSQLHHPHIVPVFHAFFHEGQLCLVMQYMEGGSLADRALDLARGKTTDVATIMEKLARAVHYVHERGVIHRDLKPGNILFDTADEPRVADFGLAMREEEFGQGPCFAGTIEYMSPEQARGEGNRVKEQTDVYSLGVILFELLAGRLPWDDDNRDELLKRIQNAEPVPPRQLKGDIPEELERICLKAMSKRALDRYPTAMEMAEDLRRWQDTNLPTGSKVIPRGLKSFDAEDSGFFLELLPGPRNRDGLPDSVSFWKTRIEATEPDQTFSVGLLFGPSGCGKTSLVKAGLLPRLAGNVVAVYLEATAGETETRLLRLLREGCPGLPALGLVETLARLRRQHGFMGKKIVIVIDQFEQWLHARGKATGSDLVLALRHCDGRYVQALVLVRDDFAMAAARFMRDLEIPIRERHNFAIVDLFDVPHARMVLERFGRFFKRLPESGKLAAQENEFLNQAVSTLAQEGKVISVRLALFVEMTKDKPWTPETLKGLGPSEELAVAFLEKELGKRAVNPIRRPHADAAREVLATLLPEIGDDIKGHMKSRGQLLRKSGYAHEPTKFNELMQILDKELRLLTACEELRSESNDDAAPAAEEEFYQLTHDFLVPALRQWLGPDVTTVRGRAQRALIERTALFTASRSRPVPPWWLWAWICLLTSRSKWSKAQRQMMRRATRVHSLRLTALAGVLVLAGWGLWEGLGYLGADAWIGRLKAAQTVEIGKHLSEFPTHRRWAEPQLRRLAAEGEPKERLHAALALVEVDPDLLDYVREQLLEAKPEELVVLRDLLQPHAAELAPPLWTVLLDAQPTKQRQRLRAAGALALYTPADDRRWQTVAHDLAGWYLHENLQHLPAWKLAFDPIGAVLINPLGDIFRDDKAYETDRVLATELLADYAAKIPACLAELLMDANEKQLPIMFDRLKVVSNGATGLLTAELAKKPSPKDGAETRTKLAKRQANAGVALFKLGQETVVWPLLKHSPDPTARSFLIHRFKLLGVDAGRLIRRLAVESDVEIRRVLLLSVGEYGSNALPLAEGTSWLALVTKLYKEDPDPGMHSSAEWVLRQWGQEATVHQLTATWVNDPKRREHQQAQIKEELASKRDKARPQWYVNGQGQRMVVIPDPGVFGMGSPKIERHIDPGEVWHQQKTNRSFALAATPVTVGQFERFLMEYPEARRLRNANGGAEQLKRSNSNPNQPVVLVSWYMAAHYCNWLSMKEGLRPDQWCYQPNPSKVLALVASTVGLLANGPGPCPLLAASALAPDRPLTGVYEEGMKLKPGHLHLHGYRLPTEAEWECACRANTSSTYFYGEPTELLEKYARYRANSAAHTWPVGALKPNDLGLFDISGNVFCMCLKPAVPSFQPQDGKPMEDNEDTRDINGIYEKDRRVSRGGSYVNEAQDLRSALRMSTNNSGGTNIGFRPARTFAP